MREPPADLPSATLCACLRTDHGLAVDPLALTQYRYAWAVSDIGAFGAQVFLRPDLGPVSRRAAVERSWACSSPATSSRSRSRQMTGWPDHPSHRA